MSSQEAPLYQHVYSLDDHGNLDVHGECAVSSKLMRRPNIHLNLGRAIFPNFKKTVPAERVVLLQNHPFRGNSFPVARRALLGHYRKKEGQPHTLVICSSSARTNDTTLWSCSTLLLRAAPPSTRSPAHADLLRAAPHPPHVGGSSSTSKNIPSQRSFRLPWAVL